MSWWQKMLRLKDEPKHVEPDEVLEPGPEMMKATSRPEERRTLGGIELGSDERAYEELDQALEGHSLADDLKAVGGKASYYPETWGRIGAKPGIHLGPEAVEDAKSPLEAETLPLANAEDLSQEVRGGVERELEQRLPEASAPGEPGVASTPPWQQEGSGESPPGETGLPPGATRDSTVAVGRCPRCGYRLPAGHYAGDQHPGCPYPH